MAKVTIEGCIGCGACLGVAPDVFDLGDDGLAYSVLGEDVPADYDADVNDAAGACPAEAIKVG
ncbi:MAG: ferredoxin [Bacilli bacterium]|nr:ferredoxin [Bacilli bacterium]